MVKKLLRGLVQTAVIIGILAVLDLGAAQVCKGRCDFVNQTEHRKKYRVRHPIYHHTLAPNVSVIAQWGPRLYPMYTNSLGFKDRMVRDVALAPTGKRLVLIGDSFIEGQGLTYETSMAGLVDEALAPQGIEVLNAAVSSYSPAIYFAKIKHLIEKDGLKFDHLAVFIDIGDIHNEATWYDVEDDGLVIDPTEEGSRRPASPHTLFANWYEDNSLIVTFVNKLRDTLYFLKKKADYEAGGERGDAPFDMALRLEKITNNRESGWTFKKDHWDSYGKRGLAEAKVNMTRLADLLRKHNIRLTVGVYPWPDQIVNKDLDSIQVREWRNWASEQGAGFVNLFPVFMDGREPLKIIEEDFIPYDIHWNEAGHIKVAAALLRFLEQPQTPTPPVEKGP